MGATDDFAAYHARREQERRVESENRLTLRKAVLPGDLPGYVLRRGDTERRAYLARAPISGWDYGLLLGTKLLWRGNARTKDVAVSRAGLLI